MLSACSESTSFGSRPRATRGDASAKGSRWSVADVRFRAAAVCALAVGFVVTDMCSGQQRAGRRLAPSWDAFPTGAWTRVITRTEDLDDQGDIIDIGIRDIVTELAEKTDRGYTLRIEGEVEVQGQRIHVDSQELFKPYDAEPTEPTPTRAGELPIGGTLISCEIHTSPIRVGSQELLQVEYYNADVYPFVLKRELVRPATETAGEEVIKVTEVIELDLPRDLHGTTYRCAVVRISESVDGRSHLSMEWISPDVPGGLVFRSVVERDPEGRVVRRSSAELVEYQVSRRQRRGGLWRRLRQSARHPLHRS